jgi:hypothetical protein
VHGVDYSGVRRIQVAGNGAVHGKTLSLRTLAFRSLPDPIGEDQGPPVSSVNISLVNFLVHHVGSTGTGGFIQTALKSDVHVADCIFENTHPEVLNVTRGGGEISNPAQAVARVSILRPCVVISSCIQVYKLGVTEASTAQRQVIQPTAQQMLRYWQAYMHVKDTPILSPVQRRLSAATPVVQIRLSSLVVTVGALLFAVGAAVRF